jgi:peptidyl-tRNA hydrolase
MTDLTELLLRTKLAELQPLRELTLPDFKTVDESDPMALTLVVNTDRTEGVEPPSEQAVLIAAAHAVDLALTDERPEVKAAIQLWCAGRIRKLVKRARASAWTKLLTHPDHIATATHEGAQVAVFLPRAISEQPSELRKLQVQGLKFEVAFHHPHAAHDFLQVQVASDLSMTTGKLAAQVGHAVQLFLMHAPEAQVLAWWANGRAMHILYVERVEAEHEVHDAGFTEVAANSLTVGANFRA